jgi:hypothetical protein
MAGVSQKLKAIPTFWFILVIMVLLISKVNGLNVNNHSNFVNRKKVGTTIGDVENDDNSLLLKDLSNKL